MLRGKGKGGADATSLWKEPKCLDTFTFIGCFCPITFYPLGEVKMTSEDRRSGSRGKIQGGRERELNHREQLVSTHSCSPLGRAQGCSVSFPWLESGNFRCVYPWSRDYGPWVPPKGLLPFLDSGSLKPESPWWIHTSYYKRAFSSGFNILIGTVYCSLGGQQDFKRREMTSLLNYNAHNRKGVLDFVHSYYKQRI